MASEWELVETQYQKMLQSDLENLSQEADLNHFYSERRALNPPPPPFIACCLYAFSRPPSPSILSSVFLPLAAFKRMHVLTSMPLVSVNGV